MRSLRAIAGVLAVTCAGAALAQAAPAPRAPFRILHVMSYHSPWRWTDGQLEGFIEGLEGLPVEFRVFQMDAKRHSAPEEKERAGREARALIERWKPDLVYASDDEAQQYVTAHYIGARLPFVFSGVNADPRAYGFDEAANVSGALEREHFLESVQLLRRIAPHVRRIAVVFDDAPLWRSVQERLEAVASKLPEVRFGPWDTLRTFDEYKRRIRAYHGAVDAVALVGIFNFKDERGNNVPYEEVLRWTVEHSTLPDLSFWVDRVHHGTLCAVTVSEREQGRAAGRIARAILAEGLRPSAVPMRPTEKGLPIINLERARKLGLLPRTGVLLTAEVVNRIEPSAP